MFEFVHNGVKFTAEEQQKGAVKVLKINGADGSEGEFLLDEAHTVEQAVAAFKGDLEMIDGCDESCV